MKKKKVIKYKCYECFKFFLLEKSEDVACPFCGSIRVKER
jgi:DNA-directed RNA polymerase subunit RPC12/RpoP